MAHLTLALAQMTVSPIPEENLKAARELTGQACRQSADMIIFPEMFMALPRQGISLSEIAESTDGQFAESLRLMAGEYQIYVIAGLWEKIPGTPRVHNTALIFSPEGRILSAYRKLHLFDALNVRESDQMMPGDDLSEIINIKDFYMGIAICYDLRFPELFRYLAFQGVSLIIVPSAWYAGVMKECHWHTLLRARAIENTCYVAGVNQAGTVFCGRSAVFDPFGVSKAEAGESPELLITRIESKRIREVRSKMPVLRHYRRELFF